MFTGCANSHPVHQRVLQLFHLPFARSEVQVDVQSHFFLGDLLVDGGDGVQSLAVEPADEELEDLWVLRGKIEK